MRVPCACGDGRLDTAVRTMMLEDAGFRARLRAAQARTLDTVVAVILLVTVATLVGAALLVVVPLWLLGYGLYTLAWWGIWRAAPRAMSRLRGNGRGISALDDEYGQAWAVLAGALGLATLVIFNWFYIGPNPYPERDLLDILNATSSTIASFIVLGALAGGLARVARLAPLRRSNIDDR